MNLPTFHVPFTVNPIILGQSGSHAYGMSTPTSDLDYKGIFIPPMIYYTSPYKNIEQVGWKLHNGELKYDNLSSISGAEEEGTLFSLEKFMKLAYNCNPNIVELLFTDRKQILICSEVGEELIKHRDLFLSQKAGKTFVGYAMSQLKRIETHKRYLDNPPTHTPLRSEYDLPAVNEINPDQLNACRAFIRRNMHTMAPWLLEADNQHKEAFWEGIVNLLALYTDSESYSELDNWFLIEEQFAEKITAKMSFDTDFLEYLRREKKFSQARSEWDKYNNWLITRNPARAALEAKYKLDTKHAAHLVRLLRMGTEILTEGKLLVLRPDAEELLAIRNGAWSYEQLVTYAKDQTDVIYQLIRSGTCQLPKEPNQQALEDLNSKLLAMYYGD